jgi:hypothetical protein
MAIVNNLQYRQIDFVQAYTQTNVEKDMNMDVPKGYEVTEPGDNVLKVNNNVYRQKQAGSV